MPTSKKSGQFTVRTAHPGDVFEISSDSRIDNEGTWKGDKLQTLSEADTEKLLDLTREHTVLVVVQELESGGSTDNKE